MTQFTETQLTQTDVGNASGGDIYCQKMHKSARLSASSGLKYPGESDEGGRGSAPIRDLAKQVEVIT